MSQTCDEQFGFIVKRRRAEVAVFGLFRQRVFEEESS